MSWIKANIAIFRGERNVPRCYCKIADSRVLDQETTDRIIKPGISYFEVRLSEMFLRDKRQYWAEYTPFVVVLTEFLHDHPTREAQREALPFLVSNHLLGQVENYINDDQIEYRNTRVAGPLPYMGDDVDLFVALYGAKRGDVSDKLFEFLGKVVDVVDRSGLSAYLNIARNMKESISSLMGINGTQYRLGTRESFSDRTGDPRQFKECYLAYINCPENKIKEENLWVKNNRLHFGTREANEPFRQHDYCLVRILERDRRNHEILPFHRLWKQTEELVLQGNHAEADVIFRHLVREVVRSPDLTRQHRIHLPLVYKVDFEVAVAQYNLLSGNYSYESMPTRGPRTALSPKAVLQRTASIAERTSLPKTVEINLREIAKRWDDIPYLKNRSKEFRLSGDIINEQLDFFSRIDAISDQDPEDLSRALALEMVYRG